MYLKLIWEGDPQGLKIFDICLEKTTWLDQEIYKLPMFEVISNNKFPLEETLIPIIKRKVFGYIYQTVPTKEILHFDSSKLIS
jgi:glutamate/tyrosine decarboxylase-like PLP-dependent enzyme